MSNYNYHMAIEQRIKELEEFMRSLAVDYSDLLKRVSNLETTTNYQRAGSPYYGGASNPTSSAIQESGTTPQSETFVAQNII